MHICDLVNILCVKSVAIAGVRVFTDKVLDRYRVPVRVPSPEICFGVIIRGIIFLDRSKC